MALLGSLFLWCFFPILNVVGLLQNDVLISPYLPVVGINIWLALSGSVIASFCVSILIHGKISVHDIIFASFTGAIAFGSSSNLIYYPVAPICVGFSTGVITTFLLSKLRREVNKKWVINSNGII